MTTTLGMKSQLPASSLDISDQRQKLYHKNVV